MNTTERKQIVVERVRQLVKGLITVEGLNAVRDDYAAKSRAALAALDTMAKDDPRADTLRQDSVWAMGVQMAILDAVRIYPLVDAVITHAEKDANYRRGWDVVIEATDWSELIDAVGNSRTAHGAISRVAKVLAIRANKAYADEIRNA